MADYRNQSSPTDSAEEANFLGSAVLIGPRHAVTCAHVLRLGATQAREVRVWFGNRELTADVADRNESADLALLKLADDSGVEPAQWTDEVHFGDTLSLVGFRGDKQVDVTGKVSAPLCDISTGDLDEIQIEPSARHGMSGGAALHNHAGRDRCVGVIREGESGSTVIGEGAVSRFLAKHELTVIPWRSPRATLLHFDSTSYRQRVAEEFATIKPPGLPPGHSVEIDRIYIHLSGASGERGSRPLEEAVAAQRRLLVFGPAGSGKTTFLKRIALAASREHDPKIKLRFRGPAMFVRISELESFIDQRLKQGNAGDPALFDNPAWIAHHLAEQHALPDAFFLNALSNERNAILLLDGLDEATGARRRAAMAGLFRKAARWPCRIVVTSRPEALQDDAAPQGFAPVSIDSLTKEAAKGFLFEWYRCVKRGDEATAARRRDRLVSAIESNRAARDMSRNPLMLTALAVVDFENNELPEQRAELYEWILDWLAKQRRDDGARPDDRLDRLSHLAYSMQAHADGHQLQVGVTEAAALLAEDSGGARKAERFLEREQLQSGIITLRRGELRFWHRAFQEFLAARYLAGSPDQERADVASRRLFELEWKEVIALLAGCLQKKHRRQLDPLLKRLVETAVDRPLSERAHAAGVLGATLADLKPTGYTLPAGARESYGELLSSVMAIFEKGAHGLAGIQDRIAAADALALTADPRLFRPADKEYWVRVDAGAFLMGSDSSDTERDGDEELRRVEITQPFLIGRFPVTVQEYGLYLEETGAAAPRDWEEQVKHPSRPVVWIPYRDAEAYCQHFECRLPSEEEWEFAARGPESRRYPWGPERPDATLANFERRIGHATPVGLFPEGSTESGIADLAGNVWEWTRTLWKGGGHVVKGGAYYNDKRLMRCSYRAGCHDDDDDFSLGFRCVREVFS